VLKDKIEIKGKIKEILVKIHNSRAVKGIQELSDSIIRPNLRIMGIEEGEEVQAKGLYNTSIK
jgi:predicted transcriptional regulator